ncbi:hypothetical protein BKA82DRAFT_4017148 [Pisolithus tinctorius]|nr:hypothetical protein BKA82DRAFT_4017148 [Pisolithus tinctorius]
MEALAARDNVVAEISYRISLGTTTRDFQAVVDPFIFMCVRIHRSPGYESQHHPKLQRRTAGTSRSLNKSVPIVNVDSNEEFCTHVKIALSLLPLDDSAEKTIAARHSILALLPLPSNIPADEVQAEVLPHSC